MLFLANWETGTVFQCRSPSGQIGRLFALKADGFRLRLTIVHICYGRSIGSMQNVAKAATLWRSIKYDEIISLSKEVADMLKKEEN